MKHILILLSTIALLACTNDDYNMGDFQGISYVRVTRVAYDKGNTSYQTQCDTTFYYRGNIKVSVDTIPIRTWTDYTAYNQYTEKIWFRNEWIDNCKTYDEGDSLANYTFWILITNIDNCPSCK